MTEQISALMDGELSDAEGVRQIELLGRSDECRETWTRYALIGDALRGGLHPGYARRVETRLQAEPTLLAPKPMDTEHQRNRRFAVPAAAAAAAVAVIAGVAFVGWVALPMFHATQPAQMAGGPLPVAASNVTADEPANVGNYIMAHQQFSPSNAMQGVAPYVRLVSEDR